MRYQKLLFELSQLHQMFSRHSIKEIISLRHKGSVGKWYYQRNKLLELAFSESTQNNQILNTFLLLISFSSTVYYRMLKESPLQSDHLEFNFIDPFIKPSTRLQTPSSQRSIQSSDQTLPSQPTILITNISFKQNLPQGQKQQKVSRIHGKQAMKKIATTHYLLINKQKKLNIQETSVNNTTLRLNLKRSQKKLLQSKYKPVASELLQNKQIQLDQQLKQILTSRKNKSIKQLHNFKFKRVNTEIPTQIIEGNNNLPIHQNKNKKSINKAQEGEGKSSKKKENRFYLKLKEKLENQMKKIQDKNKIKQNFLISGCEVFKCSNINEANHRSLTDRPRPQTAVSRTGLQIHNVQSFVKDHRPKSSRSRTLQRKQMKYMADESKGLFDILYDQKKKIRKTSKQKSQSSLQPYTHKTLRHVKPIHKQKDYISSKEELQKQKVKQKMINLIIKCEDEAIKYGQLELGLKKFQSFAKQMSNHLKQNSSILSGIQKHDSICEQLT